MADDRDPIPKALAEAFAEAVIVFNSWSPAVPNARGISLGREFYDLGAICCRAEAYNDPLPQITLQVLLGYMDLQHEDLRERLSGAPTYANGGFCLRALMTYKLDLWERQQRSE